VAIGDLDGDQAPDLAVANWFSNNVSVLLGLGDGTFSAAVHYAAGDYCSSVAIGDLDGDQVPDLAVANNDWYSGSVSVLMGAGDGSFSAAVSYATGGGPSSVAIGDLDGDQVPDLAVANTASDNVSVLLGLGDGTFAAAAYYAAGDESWSVALGDLDGDGDTDLAVANAGSDNVSVLLGLGDGTFAAAVPYAAGNHPTSVAIGDLDGDLVSDLALANTGSFPLYDDGSVSVLLGLGDGTFAPAVSYSAGERPVSVAIGDLDGNQVPDLAVANSDPDDSTVSVLLGLGDGTFAATVNYAAARGLGSVAIGDLDGDQVPDLAVASWLSDNVSMLLGAGDGTFAAAVGYAAGTVPYCVAIGDLNGDQAPDLAVANFDASASVLLHQIPGLFDCNGNAILDPCDIDCGPAAGPCDLPGCGQSADCNANGLPDECDPEYLDIELFVGQLLAESPDPDLLCMFDQNGNATLDGADIRGFVDRLLRP
jgi:hypothetical protein